MSVKLSVFTNGVSSFSLQIQSLNELLPRYLQSFSRSPICGCGSAASCAAAAAAAAARGEAAAALEKST